MKRKLIGLSQMFFVVCFTIFCIQFQTTYAKATGTKGEDGGHLIRDDRELFMEIADEWDSTWGSPYNYEKREEVQNDLKEEKRYVDVDNAEKRKRNIPKAGELFEGDIVMDETLRSIVLGEDTKRDAVKDKSYQWPGGYVPYVLDDELDDDVLASFHEAVQDFDSYTCVKFRPRKFEEDYLYIFPNESKCYSSVGRHGGKQMISLGMGCSKKGIIIHELMHSLGFVHEHSRSDRDKYVKILYDNIQEGLEHNFEKFSIRLVDHLGVSYDYDSVLHYRNSAFSKNGQDTIRSISNPRRRFGQREGFSKHDIEQINRLYNCKSELNDKSLMDDIMYD
uniref:Metalloendopeptidase n=1 Tax=Pachycerianthus maua TaxID=2736681 RepID=A0A7G7WYS7_9CNID|nr:toxin candidate TRINITY_DN29374_c0_g2_i1 [Pachycerianthus maua]